jgi:hypothetical protein
VPDGELVTAGYVSVVYVSKFSCIAYTKKSRIEDYRVVG